MGAFGRAEGRFVPQWRQIGFIDRDQPETLFRSL